MNTKIYSGIPIHERVPIPEELIPEDSRVEIDAKIHAGYCKNHTFEQQMYYELTFRPVTTGKVMNMVELAEVHGRAWEDVDVCFPESPAIDPFRAQCAS